MKKINKNDNAPDKCLSIKKAYFFQKILKAANKLTAVLGCNE
jgi:hypothetical protein